MQHKGLQAWIEHIKMTICDNQQESYRQLMRVLQLLLRGPSKKIEGLTVFVSQPGCGKNSFYTHLKDFVFGKRLTHLEAGLQTLTGNFTDHLLGKLLVVVDELAVNKEEYHPKWETLKNVTSMDELIVNGKHIRKFEIKNLSYLFIFTNRENAVFIEKKGRRIEFLNLTTSAPTTSLTLSASTTCATTRKLVIISSPGS